ncbi:MAG: HAMP domain-containing histidine kinase [Clostridia bacterium]|nr:HAMP domain-containing histidine kinase [Clostridia bacterium]
MKRSNGSKIFRRYLLGIFSIVMVSLTLMSFLFLGIETNHWKNEQTDALSSYTNVIAGNVSNLMHNYHDSTLTNTIPVYILANNLHTMSSANNCDIFICDLNGKVILCKEMTNGDFQKKNHCETHSQYVIPKSIIKEAEKGKYSDITLLGSVYSVNQLVVGTPIKSGSNTVGIVFASKSVAATIYTYLVNIARIVLFSAVIVLFAVMIISYLMAYRLSRPLRQMSYATKRFAEGDFSYKIPEKGNDELTDLAKSLNKMASSLSVLEGSRRSFVANVSHELKTPMTTIGGFIDGILDGTIPKEREAYYLNIVADEVKRLSRLVTGMLNMSKLEAGEMQINAKEFDLSQSIIKTILNFETKITSKSIEILGLDSLESFNVSADEDMLMQVIYNLIDNAIKFTPNNGYIAFKLFTANNKAYFSIRNSGDGISSEELEKVFERFYKIDKSRSFDVKGAGLGLYIVQNIITLHGGEIKATSEEGKFTDFSFWIPIKQ